MTYKGVITSIQLADDNQAFIISFYFVMNFFKKKKKTNKHIHIQKMFYVLFSDSLKRCQGWAAGVDPKSRQESDGTEVWKPSHLFGWKNMSTKQGKAYRGVN